MVARWRLQTARERLSVGAVLAYPTEAVWGLGCDPFNREAVEQLLKLKRRPMHKGLILLAASVEQVEGLLDPLEPEQRQRVLDSWPGPYTWLLPDPDNQVPVWVKGKHQSVAVRVTAHPIAAALCREFDGMLVSTSANPTGVPPARSALRVRSYFGTKVSVLPGPLGGLDRPTEIRDSLSGQLIRI